MPLDFLNVFALALPRPAILAIRSIPAVGARIVAIASISAHREPSAKCFRKITPICDERPRRERATPAMRKAEARTEAPVCSLEGRGLWRGLCPRAPRPAG